MGENYTRKTENYTTRQDRQKAVSSIPATKMISFTCWRCEKGFELPVALAKPDGVTCPHCEMRHGQITHKDN
jgi:DNA-directed RNA polymerase subunit RPC12/RpoP